MKVLAAYHAAAARVRRCAQTGGLRRAVFTLDERKLGARSELDEETGLGRIRLTSPPADASGSGWTDLPWKVTPVQEPVESEPLAALDRKMQKGGWWPGDAAAFVEAAKQAELEPNATTLAALAAVAEWLRHSSGWAPSTRSIMYAQCIQAKSEVAANEDPEASYRRMAGIGPKQAAAIVEPIGASENRREAFAARFDAAIGSALHAECAVTMGCPLTKMDAYDRSVRKSLFTVGGDAASAARRLVCHRDFQRALGQALSAARGRLVTDDGGEQAPDDPG